MQTKQREAFLKIGAAGAFGFYLFYIFIFSPAIDHWTEQGKQIEVMRAKVLRGKQLIARAPSLHARWNEMLRTQLPADMSVAESEIYKAMDRWFMESRVSFTSLTPNRLSHSEGYETLEYRATATGDQASLGRLIYALEVDPLPARLEECELSSRDAKGQQLNLVLKFSFIRLAESLKNTQ